MIVLAAGLIAVVLLMVLLFFRFRRGPDDPPAGAPVPPPPTEPAPFLAPAGDEGDRFPIDTPNFTIGRAPDNDLIIDDTFPDAATVSRHHAVIYQQNGDYVIEDQNSQNGTYVQDQPTPKNLLQDGWSVAIGRVEFVFHKGEPEGESS